MVDYQYETSPRKIEYEAPKKKKKVKAKSPKAKLSEKTIKEIETKKAQRNFTIVMAIVLICAGFIVFMNVKINESFSEVQSMTKTISNLEKENSQISVNIQNSLNLSNIESKAISELGMQKLSNKQITYVALDTKDYVEISSEKIALSSNDGFFKTLWNKFLNIF